MRTATTRPGQPVAFVLSGGAGYGAVQVGMLQALTAAGIRPDLVVGTSAGALNAAAYAADPTPAGLDRLAGAWKTARRADIFPLHPTDVLPGLLGRRDHLVSPEGLRSWLGTHLQLDLLEQTAIPVHVVATDLASGAPVVISAGDAVTALLASSAVPGIFPPVQIAGQLLLDGGITADTPISQASDLGAGTIYVLPSHGVGPAPHGRARTALGLGIYAYSQISANWTNDRVAAARGATVHLIPAPTRHRISPFDLSCGAELIAAGALATTSWLARPAPARSVPARSVPARSVPARPVPARLVVAA